VVMLGVVVTFRLVVRLWEAVGFRKRKRRMGRRYGTILCWLFLVFFCCVFLVSHRRGARRVVVVRLASSEDILNTTKVEDDRFARAGVAVIGRSTTIPPTYGTLQFRLHVSLH
jgi:hypothetical protein